MAYARLSKNLLELLRKGLGNEAFPQALSLAADRRDGLRNKLLQCLKKGFVWRLCRCCSGLSFFDPLSQAVKTVVSFVFEKIASQSGEVRGLLFLLRKCSEGMRFGRLHKRMFRMKCGEISGIEGGATSAACRDQVKAYKKSHKMKNGVFMKKCTF